MRHPQTALQRAERVADVVLALRELIHAWSPLDGRGFLAIWYCYANERAYLEHLHHQLSFAEAQLLTRYLSERQ